MSLITMPSTPAPKSIEWQLSDTIGIARSPFSLQRQTYNWGAAILRASVSLPPMSNAQALPWIAFLMACQGIANTFLFGDVTNTGPQNPAAVGGTVNGSNQTGFSLNVTSTANLTPGDWIQIGERLYRVTSFSTGVIGIWPNIRESPAGGANIILTNTVGTFCLTSNDRKFAEDESHVYRITFECEEALLS